MGSHVIMLSHTNNELYLLNVCVGSLGKTDNILWVI